MKQFLLVASLFCLVCSTSAQTLIRAKHLGERWLGSRIFPSGTGEWILLNNPGEQVPWRFMRLHERWQLDSIGAGAVVPNVQFHTKSIALDEQQAWLGGRHRLVFTSDYQNWHDVNIGEAGRTVEVSALSLYRGGVGALASLWSYVVTKSDTDANGNGTRWTTDAKRGVWLATATELKRLTPEGMKFPDLTNVEHIDATHFVVGHGGVNAMTLFDIDGNTTQIPCPTGIRTGSALSLHRTTTGDVYCFYSSADGGIENIPPSAIVYHEANMTTEYISLDRVGLINHATSSDGLVVGALGYGLAIIQGTSVRTFELVDTITTYGDLDFANPADVYGVEFINRDTLLCNTQSSFFVIPRALLTATSGVESEPGKIVSSNRNYLVNIVDGLAPTVWSIHDNAGRALQSGTLAIGERNLRLPLEGVSSGVYHLLLSQPGNHARTVALLVTQ